VLTQLTYRRSEERAARSERPRGGIALVEGDPAPRAEVVVRPARIADMAQVEPLINHFAARDVMLPKTADQLARHFREFVVAADPTGRVVACGALRIYSESLAEITSLAVEEAAHGAGLGRRIVERLLDDARELQLRTVFALTLQELFFHRLGFRTVPKEMFPLKVWADCRSCSKLHACDEIAVAKEL
jgi:amino-acid N-acetyltransferase